MWLHWLCHGSVSPATNPLSFWCNWRYCTLPSRFFSTHADVAILAYCFCPWCKTTHDTVHTSLPHICRLLTTCNPDPYSDHYWHPRMFPLVFPSQFLLPTIAPGGKICSHSSPNSLLCSRISQKQSCPVCTVIRGHVQPVWCFRSSSRAVSVSWVDSVWPLTSTLSHEYPALYDAVLYLVLVHLGRYKRWYTQRHSLNVWALYEHQVCCPQDVFLEADLPDRWLHLGWITPHCPMAFQKRIVIYCHIKAEIPIFSLLANTGFVIIKNETTVCPTDRCEMTCHLTFFD